MAANGYKEYEIKEYKSKTVEYTPAQNEPKYNEYKKPASSNTPTYNEYVPPWTRDKEQKNPGSSKNSTPKKQKPVPQTHLSLVDLEEFE